jgi:2-phosphoglycolate phosphatase
MEESGKVTGVIFDLDGTLVDSYQAIYLSFKYTYEQIGIPPLPFEKVKKAVGLGIGITFRELLGEGEVARALSLFRQKYAEVFRDNTFLLPDVRELLEKLQGAGVHMAVATNKLGNFSRAIFEHFSLQNFFVAIIGDGDVSENKPNPEMIYHAIRKMGVRKEDTAFVGDSVIDIQTARNAGLRVFAVPTGNTAREDLEKARPTAMLNRLLDLLEYVP